MDKTILITGGAGYIGTHTTTFLLNKGFKVIVFDNLSNGNKEFVDSRATFIQGDLKNLEEIDNVFEKYSIDCVVHFAAFIEAGESMKEPLKYFKNNVSNSIHLFQTMIKHNCLKIVFSSTAAVYGEPKSVPIFENFEKKPTNYYGQSKLMVEQILDSLDDSSQLKSVCLRYFNASGAGYEVGEAHSPETHIIPLVLLTALGHRDKICIFGDNYQTNDGTCVRDYIHVLDLANAHYLALNHLFSKDDVDSKKYNLGSGEGYSVKEIIDTCKEVTGVDFRVDIESRREGDPAKLIANSNLIKEELNWEAKYSLHEIISSAWIWHKKYNGFANNKN